MQTAPSCVARVIAALAALTLVSCGQARVAAPQEAAPATSANALRTSRNIHLVNRLSVPVWAAWQGSTVPDGGGVYLAPNGGRYILVVPNSWTAARIWGRTGCAFDSAGAGPCETGDCGRRLACGGAGGRPPATLAEWTLNGAGGQDYYDVSLVDGYNLPMVLQPVAGTFTRRSDSHYECNAAGCASDLNASCPAELQVKNGSGSVIACNSACNQFNTDQYCCRNAYGQPSTCPPTNYSRAFKAACTEAYSYAYDDAASTFVCVGADYEVIFGTSGSASPAPTPSPDPGLVSGKVYQLIAQCSGKALDIASGSTADGARAVQWTAGDDLSQRWKLTDMGQGYFKLQAMHSGLVLDVAWGSKDDGASVQQARDNGSCAQRWKIDPTGDGTYKLASQCSGKMLDVSGASTADGASVQQWADNGTAAQRWSLVAASNPTPPASADFTQGVDRSSGAGLIWFRANGFTPRYVDVHYQLNGGPKLNLRMGYEAAAARNTYRVAGLWSGSALRYNFTYEKNGLQYDSPSFDFTY